jgi:hypothetical protein
MIVSIEPDKLSTSVTHQKSIKTSGGPLYGRTEVPGNNGRSKIKYGQNALTKFAF